MSRIGPYGLTAGRSENGHSPKMGTPQKCGDGSSKVRSQNYRDLGSSPATLATCTNRARTVNKPLSNVGQCPQQLVAGHCLCALPGHHGSFLTDPRQIPAHGRAQQRNQSLHRPGARLLRFAVAGGRGRQGQLQRKRSMNPTFKVTTCPRRGASYFSTCGT